jgi:hypothetical protein
MTEQEKILLQSELRIIRQAVFSISTMFPELDDTCVPIMEKFAEAICRLAETRDATRDNPSGGNPRTATLRTKTPSPKENQQSRVQEARKPVN